MLETKYVGNNVGDRFDQFCPQPLIFEHYHRATQVPTYQIVINIQILSPTFSCHYNVVTKA